MPYNNIKLTKHNKRLYKNNSFDFKTIFINLSIIFVVLGIIFSTFIYLKYIKHLPNIRVLEELNIKESSIIYDKKGNELYRLFGDEKRTYINYSQISKNMVNAIVAGEDKNFFVNTGIDFKGLLRAVFNYAVGKSTKIEGTSTISQQLIRNSLITNERSLERKIKEFYLSYKMTKSYSKEKILELYLNKISFGSNSYGIEQASLTFFNKQAKDLNFLEASILASIPKGPTYYSPYTHFDRLMGYTYVYNVADEKNIKKLITKKDLSEQIQLVSQFKENISNLKSQRLGNNGISVCGIDKVNYKNISVDGNGCKIMNYSDLLGFLNNIKISSGENVLEYQTGRKDFILGRMLEDEYITFEQYKKGILDGVGFEFKEYKENIKFPHFVLYVKDYLSQKYGEDLIEEGGLKIYTTLDPDLQNKAQEIIKKQVISNKAKFDANNAALISIDNKTGDVLALVGGADYFDKSIDGNVNMITSKRQPGSTFKPFVYALAIDKNQIGPHTPIYDLPTKFPGGYEPKNFNGKFNGKMNLMTALNYSRNIPAIKLYFLAGEQGEIISYLKKAGVKSLDDKFSYGAPLALGAGEITPLELAKGYTIFANMGNRIEINPISKIYDSKGILIEEKTQTSGIRILNEKTAYIMNYILSSTTSRPDSFWNNSISLKNRQAGAKTGTSNKIFMKNQTKQYLPGDLWTAGYTPQITTVVWAGNTDGKAISSNGDGLNGAAPIWKAFMEYAHMGKEPLTWKKPNNLPYTTVSKISGLLPTSSTDSSFLVQSLFTNPPTKYDNSLTPVEVDMMCNGKVGPDTPLEAIKKGYFVQLHSINPNNSIWEAGVQTRAKNGGIQKEFAGYTNIITDYKDEICDRSELSSTSVIDLKISTDSQEFFAGKNPITISYKSNNPLIKFQFILGGKIIQENYLNGQTVGTFKTNIEIPTANLSQDLKVKAIDQAYLSTIVPIDVKISQKDTTPPIITLINPDKANVSIYEDQFLNVRGIIQDSSAIRSVNFYIDGTSVSMGSKEKDFVFEVNKDKNLTVGKHTLKVESYDLQFNKSEISIELEVLKR